MLSILYVCTGNICRSPFAERYTHLLADRGAAARVATSSAGVGSLVGHPMDPPMDILLQRSGGSAEGFASRQISREHITDSDVIITMETYHRDWILEDHPRAMRRTFTLGQLMRQLADPEMDDLVGDELLTTLSERRRRARSRDDVPDPYRRGEAAMAEAAARITSALDVVIPRLAPPRLVD